MLIQSSKLSVGVPLIECASSKPQWAKTCGWWEVERLPTPFSPRSTGLYSKTPSIIGSGIPLFNGPFEHVKFQPVDQTLLSSGVRVLVYDRV